MAHYKCPTPSCPIVDTENERFRLTNCRAKGYLKVRRNRQGESGTKMDTKGRHKQVRIRTNEGELSALKTGANKDALPVSTWLRNLGFERIKEQRKEQ